MYDDKDATIILRSVYKSAENNHFFFLKVVNLPRVLILSVQISTVSRRWRMYRRMVHGTSVNPPPLIYIHPNLGYPSPRQISKYATDGGVSNYSVRLGPSY